MYIREEKKIAEIKKKKKNKVWRLEYNIMCNSLKMYILIISIKLKTKSNNMIIKKWTEFVQISI